MRPVFRFEMAFGIQTGADVELSICLCSLKSDLSDINVLTTECILDAA